MSEMQSEEIELTVCLKATIKCMTVSKRWLPFRVKQNMLNLKRNI